MKLLSSLIVFCTLAIPAISQNYKTYTYETMWSGSPTLFSKSEYGFDNAECPCMWNSRTNYRTGSSAEVLMRSHSVFERDEKCRITVTTTENYDEDGSLSGTNIYETIYQGDLMTAREVYFLEDGLIFPEYTVSYEYDSDGRMILESSEYYPMGTWIYNSKTEYAYDNYGNQVEIRNYSYMDNSYLLEQVTENTYDNENLLMESLFKDYNYSTGEFTNRVKFEYSYSAGNDAEEVIISQWNIETNTWLLYEKRNHFYNGNGLLTAIDQLRFSEDIQDFELQGRESYSDFCGEYPEIGTDFLYPNPSNGIISFVSKLPDESTAKFSITDARGRLWQEGSFTSNGSRIQLDIQSLSAGVYYLKYVSGEGDGVLRFVKTP